VGTANTATTATANTATALVGIGVSGGSGGFRWLVWFGAATTLVVGHEYRTEVGQDACDDPPGDSQPVNGVGEGRDARGVGPFDAVVDAQQHAISISISISMSVSASFVGSQSDAAVHVAGKPGEGNRSKDKRKSDGLAKKIQRHDGE